MNKAMKFLIIVFSMIATAAAVKVLCEIFSTRMQKYYLVDGGE